MKSKSLIFTATYNESENIDNYLKKLSPDLIIVSPANMRFCEQTDYIKSAKTIKLSI